jgi:hypothetical protein
VTGKGQHQSSCSSFKLAGLKVTQARRRSASSLSGRTPAARSGRAALTAHNAIRPGWPITLLTGRLYRRKPKEKSMPIATARSNGAKSSIRARIESPEEPVWSVRSHRWHQLSRSQTTAGQSGLQPHPAPASRCCAECGHAPSLNKYAPMQGAAGRSFAGASRRDGD